MDDVNFLEWDRTTHRGGGGPATSPFCDFFIISQKSSPLKELEAKNGDLERLEAELEKLAEQLESERDSKEALSKKCAELQVILFYRYCFLCSGAFFQFQF